MLDSILADRELVVLQLKFVTMFIVSRLLAGANILSTEWIMEVIYLLLGLATYSLIIKKFIPKDINSKHIKSVINVNALYGTMLIVSRLLSGNDFTAEWMNSVVYILLGFTTYNIVIKDLIPFNKFKDSKIKHAINDSLEIFVMSIVSQFLSGKTYNSMWFYSTLYTSSGFIVYHLLISYILS
tara:strand:+ start:1403 stop:1951 length:549 start_codon:yes stop_codon:yes gene_type:complete